jgi:thiamine biosynthesis lipoprotein
LIAVLIIAQTGCSNGASSAEPVVGEEYKLDTICTVSVYEIKASDGSVTAASEMQEEAQAVIDDAFKLCDELERKLSRTITGSDISKINEAGGEWTSVSNETTELIKKGIEYSDLSGGAFDITVGDITELWDFHAAEGKEKLPDADALAKAAEHIDYRKIEIDGDKVRITDPESKIDLGGIAKGYIGDKMAELIESSGVTSAIINLGGNVICIGGKNDEEDFVIGVEAPFSDRTEIVGKVKARDKTLVTSGIYERKMEIDGKIYHHILNSETGWPVETNLDAVTLIADKGYSADIDALSTICLIKGAEDGKDLIEKTDGVEGIFIKSDGNIETTAGAEFEASK